MLKQAAIYEIDVFVERYPALAFLRDSLLESVAAIKAAYRSGGKILICGNGGSAADSLHVVGELMKGFALKRELPAAMAARIMNAYPEDAQFYLDNLQQAIPAISLVSETSLITAFSNDTSAELVFAQQVLGYGAQGDILLAISTSGDSANVLHAAKLAKCMEMSVISLTGQGGGQLKEYSDILLEAPSVTVHQTQEFHLPIYHALCLAIEAEIFG